MKKIDILISTKIELYVLEPIIDFLLKKGCMLSIWTNQSIQEELNKRYPSQIQFYKKTNSFYQKLLKIFHKIFLILFTPHEFSSQYRRMMLKIFTKRRNIWSVFYNISYITPKLKDINSKTFHFFKYITPNYLNGDLIIVPSLNAYGHILNNSRYKIITILESWDHVMKVPNGYLSNKVFTWNQDLNKDWYDFQESTSTETIFPLKLRYAINNRITNQSGNKIVYAAAFTRLYSNPTFERLEKEIIHEICKSTKLSSMQFHIKPRPISDFGEFEEFLKYDHVSIGDFKSPEKNAANYYFSDQDNISRFEEIKNVKYVINCFTTFALDAALYGIPVLQLDLRRSHTESKALYRNHHIEKYFISSRNTLKVENDLTKELLEYNSSPRKNHILFSSELSNWISPEKNLEKSLESFYKSLS